MVKLNLQLFALNKTTSIVDYLKSQGQDSSFNARKNLATSNGIQNYTGTAEQNNQLLGILQGGSKSTGNPSKASSGSSNPAKASSGSSNPSKASGGSNGTGSNSAGASGGAKPASGASINGVSQSTMDVINTPFQSSAAYQEAMNYTNQLLEQLSSGRTSYTDKINTLMEQIQNRDKFEYDVDQDMLFQQYLASSMASGKTAMQDTMGQAASLTGGYGSTYATSAANQQYNAYIQDAYNNLPEYYNLALEAYQMEGEDMYNQFAMLSQADATEYDRLYNSWNANFNNAQQMYSNEYSSWQDAINNAFNVAGMQNSDYWNSKEMGYKYAALQQDQEQFDKNYDLNQQEMMLKYDVNGDGVIDKKDKEASIDYKEPSASQYAEILRILNEEGEDALYKYVDSLGEDIDVEAINKHIETYGRGNLSGRTFTVINPGESKRYAGKVNYGVFRDQYGNDYTLEEIEAIDKDAAAKLKDLKKGQKVILD